MKPLIRRAEPAALPAGRPWPLGIEWVEAENSFQFALYSRHATGVTLLCYAERDPAQPVFEFRLRHPAHKTGSIWHCRIPATELRGATLYAYRVEGPHDPQRGHRFDPRVPMLVAGDEFLNTQRGNNNPYNQDNAITWLDWARLEQIRDTG